MPIFWLKGEKMKARIFAFGMVFLLLTTTSSASIVELTMMNSGAEAPSGFSGQEFEKISRTAVMLSGVPTSEWTYGCSATAAGMIFGYYDRHGYSNMYTGPANGGVAPLTDLGSMCSIIATKNGFDGRTTAGHVDDYWISYGSAGPDPWDKNGWAEHTWEGCTADYMGTNQWKWSFLGDEDNMNFNLDGATALWAYNGPWKLYDYVPPECFNLPQTALCHGMRLFAESCGYTVLENYTQKIDTLYRGGFSFKDYMEEIDAGCPVMIQLTGHSMIGVGYDARDKTVYVHDTWDNEVHSMLWGGSYADMGQIAVTVIHLDAVPTEVPEPATIGLLSFGTLILLVRRR
jgi:hypothetical protein